MLARNKKHNFMMDDILFYEGLIEFIAFNIKPVF